MSYSYYKLISQVCISMDMMTVHLCGSDQSLNGLFALTGQRVCGVHYLCHHACLDTRRIRVTYGFEVISSPITVVTDQYLHNEIAISLLL